MVESIVAAARSVQREWAKRSVSDRLSSIEKTRTAIAQAPKELAAACGRSNLAETLAGEVLPLADACLFLEKTAAETLRTETLSGKGKPQWMRGVRIEVRREALGLVLLVAPSNYPLMLPGIQALQALVAGNGVLIKPAIGCTAPAEAFVGLLRGSGVDPNLVQVLPEANSSVNEAVVAGVDRVVLTGSAETGRSVQKMLADTLTPSAMELSGCDAVFVTESADVERAVKCLAMGLRFNQGRTCIAPRRVFVVRSLLSTVEERLKAELEHAGGDRVSDAKSDALPARASRPSQREGVVESEFTLPSGGADAPAFGEGSRATPALVAAAGLVDDAIDNGATMLVDGIFRGGSEPYIARETVITNASPEFRLLKTDVFAPVMSIVPFDELDDALAMNEKCPYALGSTIFSASPTQIDRIIDSVNAGCVVVNDMIVPTADPRVSFGGRAESGFGVTRGTAGLLEMTQLKTIVHRTGNWLPHLDSATPHDADVLAKLISVMHSNNPLAKAKSGIGLAKAIRAQRKYRKR